MNDCRPSGPRVFVDATLAPGAETMLGQGAAHHVARVLRLRPGDRLTVFNGEGGEHGATIAAIERSRVVVRVGAHRAIERESPLSATLLQGLSSGERMDFTVQKSVELGVAAIQPVAAERSVTRLAGERAEARRRHWQGIAVAACEQCGRNRIPEVRPVLPLARYVAPPGALKIVLDPAAAERLRDLPPASSAVLAVGPEAGWSEAEARQLVAAGFRAVRLGPRTLRTETAAPAALAALNALLGDF